MLTTILFVIVILLVTYVACLHNRLNLLSTVIRRHERMLMSQGIAILQNKTRSK